MSLEISSGELLFERRGADGQIDWVTFNRPQARNTLTFAMYEDVAQVVAEAGRGYYFERSSNTG